MMSQGMDKDANKLLVWQRPRPSDTTTHSKNNHDISKAPLPSLLLSSTMTTMYRDFAQHSTNNKTMASTTCHSNLPGRSSNNVSSSPTLNHTNSSMKNYSFPMKLHYMLNEVEKDGMDHIVSWQPHGRCFMVHNRAEFVKRISPCWFRQSKITSFQRQLNIYGFRRLTGESDKGGYYHEYFLRENPALCKCIQRTTVKGTGTRKPSSPESEPNFYNL